MMLRHRVLGRVPFIFLVQLYPPQAARSLINHNDTLRLVCLVKQHSLLTEAALRGLSVWTYTHKHSHTHIYILYIAIWAWQRPSVPWNRESYFSPIFKSHKSSLCCCGLWCLMMGCHIASFPVGDDILTLSAHYLHDMQLYGDIWSHGDTLYPPISLFPPLVLRSLKVTSVWLPLRTGPVHFMAELYIWTPLVSLTTPPPPSLARPTPCMLYSWLIPLPPPPLPNTFHSSGDRFRLP